MIARYSTCHFAEVMPEYSKDAYIGEKCSFCGKDCHLLPTPRSIEHDVELTLRRWKDGDCSLDDMFYRLNKEFQRAWQDIFEVGKRRLQKKGRPKYEYIFDHMRWERVKGNDMLKSSPDNNTKDTLRRKVATKKEEDE